MAAKALIHVGTHCTVWAGPAEYLAPHEGSAPVLLTGLYADFELRLPGQRWYTVSAALIPPRLLHELQFHGSVFSALYVEPTLGGSALLAGLLQGVREIGGVLVGRATRHSWMRSLYESRPRLELTDAALDDLFERRPANYAVDVIDGRIAAIVAQLSAGALPTMPLAALAAQAGLSPSRFQHLFTRQVGVPYRRFRAWSRLRHAWRALALGYSVTQAAYEAGFCDSAHFSHEYRRTFGTAVRRRQCAPDHARRRA